MRVGGLGMRRQTHLLSLVRDDQVDSHIVSHSAYSSPHLTYLTSYTPYAEVFNKTSWEEGRKAENRKIESAEDEKSKRGLEANLVGGKIGFQRHYGTHYRITGEFLRHPTFRNNNE